MKTYSDKFTIKSWAEDDRPREKLISKGRQVLSDAELIAILIGSGSREESAVELSKKMLKHYENDIDVLAKVSVQELMQFKGIGEAKAVSIVAALELGRRRKYIEKNERIKIGIAAAEWASSTFTAVNYANQILKISLSVQTATPILETVNAIYAKQEKWGGSNEIMLLPETLLPLNIFQI